MKLNEEETIQLALTLKQTLVQVMQELLNNTEVEGQVSLSKQ